MNYEVVPDKETPDVWRVEAIDYDADGQCYVAVFTGAQAQERAREYAAWKATAGERAAVGVAVR